MPWGHLKTIIGTDEPIGVNQWGQGWRSTAPFTCLHGFSSSVSVWTSACFLPRLFFTDLGSEVRMMVSTLHHAGPSPSWMWCRSGMMGRSLLLNPNMHVRTALVTMVSMPQFPLLHARFLLGLQPHWLWYQYWLWFPVGSSQGLGPRPAPPSSRCLRKSQFYYHLAPALKSESPVMKHQLRANHTASQGFSCFSYKMRLNIFVCSQNFSLLSYNLYSVKYTNLCATSWVSIFVHIHITAIQTDRTFIAITLEVRSIPILGNATFPQVNHCSDSYQH